MATNVNKVKKVEVPIDKRETFVSLQKNFADSELSVEEKLATLYRLQKADNEIEKILQLRGELPAEVSSLEGDIEAMNAKTAHLSDMIAEYGNSIEANKQQIVDLDAEITKYQEQLANIANSREFDSINKEIENLNLLRQIAEKHIGEAKYQIEKFKEDIEAINAKIDIRNADLEAKKAELATIVESTSKKEEELQAKRDELAGRMDERTMSAYDRIRGSVRNRLAVVSLYNGDSCGGCFSTLTPMRIEEVKAGNKLVICEHCGRIIVTPELG